ncbi:rod shape-determining protein RodA [Psychroserpens sp.]|uniref:rod shape-determining protein RodA n=1 Tax=Psychroserpens sp. TaxID=2020870 RepID=UPI001B2D0999|nr:rod shape-determining protein RodA [Psychroserpens sp.]MBO6605967.1 rod shape-determining protein RodA [Psychroserpens sp.]MBO6652662.1 rod shape-determining protein RodA [Psychroserpens sp.]MBO6681566.1 rod shape-determining protein RodA [Psychroserpens sp.]MBO6749341.1 rod shape-determining protein RodA [Psychroserpens sp.]MBO6914213.1 rod shape-determining protein RodA [Psychroserpens sp.]
MNRERHRGFKFDWIIIVLFLLLVGFGWINIISASHDGEIVSYFDTSQLYGKQLIFLGLTFVLIVLILSIEAKFYERFASIIYILAMLALVGLFVFGKEINGAKSWYGIGSMTLQPSEFAKFATALAVAKYMSDLQTDMNTLKDQLRAIIIIIVPAVLILLQNDAGSTLVYASFFFVFYREGLQQVYLALALSTIILAVLSLKYGIVISGIAAAIVIFGAYFFRRKQKRISILQSISVFVICIVFASGVKLFYQNVLKPHQQNRISLWLRLEKDPVKLEQMKKEEAYNLIQSEQAISSGGWTGKGFLQGTRTTGKFVPEQPTDYIFSTVGEEWGFMGSAFVVILFMALIIRILYLAESQKSQFSRVYGYGVASIFFIHFTINTGMVMGLIPTVGIPLPFFSYGGSGLWGFTILLFIFVKLDSNKINEW